LPRGPCGAETKTLPRLAFIDFADLGAYLQPTSPKGRYGVKNAVSVAREGFRRTGFSPNREHAGRNYRAEAVGRERRRLGPKG